MPELLLVKEKVKFESIIPFNTVFAAEGLVSHSAKLQLPTVASTDNSYTVHLMNERLMFSK